MDAPDAVGRASAMIMTLLIVMVVGVVLERITRGPRLRLPRRIAWAGAGVIYAAASRGALVLALMRSHAIVRRDDNGSGSPRP